MRSPLCKFPVVLRCSHKIIFREKRRYLLRASNRPWAEHHRSFIPLIEFSTFASRSLSYSRKSNKQSNENFLANTIPSTYCIYCICRSKPGGNRGRKKASGSGRSTGSSWARKEYCRETLRTWETSLRVGERMFFLFAALRDDLCIHARPSLGLAMKTT